MTVEKPKVVSRAALITLKAKDILTYILNITLNRTERSDIEGTNGTLNRNVTLKETGCF